MGRPRQFDESTAVHAATEVFWQKGYQATNLTDLCEATHMNRPSLYGAFGDKEDLFLRCLRDYQANFGARLAEDSDQLSCSLEKIISLLKSTAAFLESKDCPNGCLAVLIMGESRGLSPRLKKVMETAHDENARNFTHLLQAAIEEGKLPADLDTAGTADFLTVQLYGAAIQASVKPGQTNKSISVAISFLRSLQLKN